MRSDLYYNSSSYYANYAMVLAGTAIKKGCVALLYNNAVICLAWVKNVTNGLYEKCLQ